jgi:carboxyl-terminal processing protease
MSSENQKNPVKPRSRQPNIGLISLLWVLLLGSMFAVREGLRHPPKLRQVERAAAIAPARINAALLADSILSIVQTYYVDAGRVSHASLVDLAIKGLRSSLPGFSSGRSGDTRWVKYEGRKLEFPISENLEYESAIEHLGDLSMLIQHGIDSDHTVVAARGSRSFPNDPDSRHGSSIVLNALLTALDAHSALLSSSAYKELRQGTEGAFGGLGVLVGMRDSLLTVIRPLPRSPAIRAGIKQHDRILTINGTHTFGSTLDQLVEVMRGEPGTDVQISVLRDEAHAPRSFDLKREIIHVDSVVEKDSPPGSPGILHLQIENFATRTSRELLSAIKKQRKKNGGWIEGLILDLRSNPGGLLDQAIQVADLFLDKGVIVSTRGRREEVEFAGPGYDEVDFPVIVLINGESASASEIVAGALQDHGRALVIGQPSFGKGSVQTIFELPEERALKLTIARYYTPSNRSIQNVGIIPDIWWQPVESSADNINLLGSARYRNERFLKNHLSGDSVQEDSSSPDSKTVIKGFWQKDAVSSITGKSKNSESEDDPEFKLATSIIRRVREVHGRKIPEGARRASHWVAIAGPKLKQELESKEAYVLRNLRKNFNIDWSLGANETNPRLGLETGSIPAKVKVGEKLEIPWKVRNDGDATVWRASVFVRSDSWGIDTSEVLIGRIDAGDSKSGKFELIVPWGLSDGKLNLRVGLALEAWPLPDGASDLVLEVESRPHAALTAKATLKDGGLIPGVLESGEQAKLELEIANVSEMDANDVELKIQNLSGKQLRFKEQTLRMNSLASGAVKTLAVDLVGGSSLLDESLSLGLAIECKESPEPVYSKVDFDAQPSKEKSSKKSTEVIAH